MKAVPKKPAVKKKPARKITSLVQPEMPLQEPKPLTVALQHEPEPTSVNQMLKQLKVARLTDALMEIRDALKSRFPDDPTAAVEITPFADGFTLNAAGLDDDEAPADASARQIATILFTDRPQLRKISNRVVHRTSNRQKSA